jgi:hypothetical protein
MIVAVSFFKRIHLPRERYIFSRGSFFLEGKNTVIVI